MTFQSEADYFDERARTCRSAAARCKNVFDALANADLADRYEAYAKASRSREEAASSEASQ